MSIIWGFLLRVGGLLLVAYCLTRKSTESVPTCYGSDPCPQSAAENDCYNCSIRNACHKASTRGKHEGR